MVQFLAALAAIAGIAAVNAIPTISAKGSKFFTSEGDQFYIKGIAYQLIPDDPLFAESQCATDAAVMKSIGTNSIRVYHVETKYNHDACMKAFADAGIYVWLDLDTFDTYVTQDYPRWNETQRDRYAEVMDQFHGYDNLAGFFVGNEAITNFNGSVTAPYIKAAARDLKAYRDSKKYRKIPIGYSAADIAQLRPMLQNYLACGSNTSEALDFFALNSYSWCGTSSYAQSGYNMLEKNSTELNIPIFMSETGCNTARPRDFKDQEAIFGEMSDTWSGSIIYEWIEEQNNYGLIKYGDFVPPEAPDRPFDGWPRSGTPIPMQPDFDNLSKVWKGLNPTGVKADSYNPSISPVPCPEFTASAWEVHPEAALPSLGQAHDFAQPPPSGTGNGGQGGGSPTSDAQPGASESQGAASDTLSRDLKSMGAVMAGVLAVVAWL